MSVTSGIKIQCGEGRVCQEYPISERNPGIFQFLDTLTISELKDSMVFQVWHKLASSD